MNGLALLDSMQLEVSPTTGGVGALIGGTIATVGQFAVPVGLATGIFGSISENDRLRNRGYQAAGIGVAAFIIGVMIAGVSIAAIDEPTSRTA